MALNFLIVRIGTDINANSSNLIYYFQDIGKSIENENYKIKDKTLAEKRKDVGNRR